MVRVQHAHGIETVYAHLSSVLVGKGSFVTTQDVIGTMGNTGYSDAACICITKYGLMVNQKILKISLPMAID